MYLLSIMVILVLLDYIYFRIRYAKPNGPPVWYGLPFVGILPFYYLPNPLFSTLYRWYLRNFPDVIITRCVFPLVIVKNAAIYDAQNSDHCLSRVAFGFEKAIGYFTVGRPYWFLFDENHHECDWRSVRKANVAALHVLPKHQQFERISEVVENFLKTIDDQKGRPWDYENDLFFAKIQESSNVNLGMSFQENQVKHFIGSMRKVVQHISYIITLTTFVPYSWLLVFENFLPKFMRPSFPSKLYCNFTRCMLEGKSRTTGKPRNFIEAVLRIKEPEAAFEFMRETTLFNLVATTHTTQHSTMATLSHVSLNEEIKGKIQRELKLVLGSEPLKFEHLTDLHYLKAALHEAYRMTPPIPLVHRYSTAPVPIGGFTVDANMRVCLLLVSEGLNEKNFPENRKFIPERHLNEQGHFEASKYFNVFSRGKRMCSGQEIASMSALIYCAKILQHFDIFPADKNKEVPDCAETIVPKTPSVPLRFVRRDGAPGITPIDLNYGLTTILNKVLEEQSTVP